MAIRACGHVKRCPAIIDEAQGLTLGRLPLHTLLHVFGSGRERVFVFKLMLYAATLVAGICNAVEPGQNATLSKGLGQPWLAALILVFVNAVIFFGVGVATHKLAVPSFGQIARIPWWAWLGGVTSAVIVTAQLFVSEKVGAGVFLGLLVTAGVVTSILLDNFGLVGFKVHPASIWRVLGGALMIVGVSLVALF